MKPIQYPIAGPEDLDREQREFLEQLYQDSGGRPLMNTDVPAITLAIVMANSTWAVAQAEWAATRIRLGATTREAVNITECIRRGMKWRPEDIGDESLRSAIESDAASRYLQYAEDPEQWREDFLTTEDIYAAALPAPPPTRERKELTDVELRALMETIAEVSQTLHAKQRESATYVVPKTPELVEVAVGASLWGLLAEVFEVLTTPLRQWAFLEGVARRLAPESPIREAETEDAFSTAPQVVEYRERMGVLMGLPPLSEVLAQGEDGCKGQ